MIALENVRKSFGAFTALDGISVAFKPGVVSAVLGPNGSGKTTLLKTLLGLVHPDEGSVLWEGARVNGDGRIRDNIAYMPQMAHYPENLRIGEFLDMIAGLRRARPVRRNDMMGRFALNGLEKKPLKGLSGGTRQRVCAVMALMFDVPVYILDEPTAGLDPLMARRFKNAVLMDKDAGKTILLTSHILADIQELADRIVYLNEGRVVFDGSVEQMYEEAGEDDVERAIASMIERGAGRS